jgi:uncharacterized glyoxalase superfamily protein PhnB
MNGPHGKVMHAEIKVGDSIFMLCDEMPEQGCVSASTLKNSPVSLHIYVQDVDAAFSKALKAGAKVVMPLSDMYWGDRFGMFVDPFGHKWSMATHKQEPTPAQIKKGQDAFLLATASA